MLSGPCFVMLRELFPSLLSQHMFLLKLQKGLVPLPCNCFLFFILFYFFCLFFPYFFHHFLLCTTCHLQERTRQRETEEEIFYFFSCGCPMWLKAWSWRQLLETDWWRDQKREEREVETQKREKKKPRKVFWPKYTYRPKHTEIHRNSRNTPKHLEIFTQGGMGGCLVLVCIPVRDFPTVPIGTEWNIQLW